VLLCLLAEEEGLSAHSSILNLSPATGKRYIWYHHQLKPMGLPIDLQCHACGCLRLTRITFKNEAIHILCTNKVCKKSSDILKGKWLLAPTKNMKTDSGWGTQNIWGPVTPGMAVGMQADI
jgi:hypothetical protein